MTEKRKEKKGMQSLSPIRLSLQFKKNEVSIADRGETSGVLIKDGVIWGEPGTPALPWRRLLVAIPWDAKVGEIKVEARGASVLSEGILVEPIQPNKPTLLGASIPRQPLDRKFYASKQIWPARLVRFIRSRRLGGIAMAEIEVCPFKYHLAEKRLELCEQLDLTVALSSTGKLREKPCSIRALKYEHRIAQYAKKQVLNPEIFDSVIHGLDGIELTDFDIYPPCDYVIVTNAALSANLQRLGQWRTLFGMRTKVVTVEDIQAGTVPDTGGAVFWQTSGFADGGTRDIAEAVRGFLKWARVNWGVSYILLGGDTNIIPCRQGLMDWIGNCPMGNLQMPYVYDNQGYAPLASSEAASAAASNVLDKDPNTVWQCAAGDTNPWLQLMLGNQPINHIELTWGSTHASSYTIQISVDGVTWTNLYSTTSGAGGTEQIPFPCMVTASIRLSIQSGTAFALGSFKVFGPSKNTTFPIDTTTSRIYRSTWVQPNPTNSLDGDLVIIHEGPHAGMVIPYNTAASSTTLGWRFVTDLLTTPGAISTNTTQVIEICGPAEHHGNGFQLKTNENYIPADLYYSDIDTAEYTTSTLHDWDADGNGVYGETFGGNLDAIADCADVYLGRAPLKTPAEADIFIDKVLRYERYVCLDAYGIESLIPPDFAVSVLLGAQNWFDDSPGSLDGTAACSEDVRHDYRALDPSRWIFTRHYQDYADVPVPDQGPDLVAASHDEILNGIKNGNHVMALSSHGNYGYLCYLDSNDIQTVSNIPGLMYGNACLTNEFDVPLAQAISELSILNANGGAVAYVGNSRYGWTGDGPLMRSYWGALLDHDRVGEMFNHCKETAASSWEKYSLNLLGDPAMRVWSDRPRQIDVSHASMIYTGHQVFNTSVTCFGAPVAGALVCLSMPDGLFATGITGAGGDVTITITPATEGIMKVGVSAKNHLPYLGSVSVKKSTGGCHPLISCPSITCHTSIFCGPLIQCHSSIACGAAIHCSNKILCSATVQCHSMIGCSMSIGMGCPAIDPEVDPEDWKIFEHIREIWGIQDLSEFILRVNAPEIQQTLERLPKSIIKPILQLIERIKGEQKS
jgi:hypothetical protein